MSIIIMLYLIPVSFSLAKYINDGHLDNVKDPVDFMMQIGRIIFSPILAIVGVISGIITKFKELR